MRTTLNISDATLEELKDRASRLKRPLNSVAEEMLQRGLSAAAQPAEKVKIKTFPVGINPAYRGLSMNQLYDQLEAENFLPKLES
jgi:hypothetical protein